MQKSIKLKEAVDGKIEEVLLEILPEAFAVVKETARRFTENESIEVLLLKWTETSQQKEIALR